MTAEAPCDQSPIRLAPFRIASKAGKRAALLSADVLERRWKGIDMSRKDPIAIIGIGCRFPGNAHGPDAFWELLANGVDAVSEVPADRWNIDAFYDPRPGQKGKSISRW